MPRSASVVGSTRRTVILAAAAAVTAATAAATATGWGRDEPKTQPARADLDPAQVVDELTAGLSRTGPYRDPDADERSRARRAARLLIDHPDDRARQEELFAGLGFGAWHGTDPATGRPFTIFLADGSDERTWGALVLDRSAGARQVVQVPHPSFDLDTEKVGLALHRRLPGSVLLVAGAHREAAGGAADVAHNGDSLFHTLAVEFARRGLDQVQLHGFADRNLEGADAVVSTGSAPRSQVAGRIAEGLSRSGLNTCRAWSRKCGQLEGTRNAQGRASAGLDSAFVHLELSWSVRRDAVGRDLVAQVLAERLRG
ncbi:hypothetical protein [Micromonospora sagamiensis]|uniref:hypothetical protein n=1 Tax=Micromonospora sagamiensis TaxID=47875 RepID=UPI00185F91B0|nr:hypothetical protein [Micromonospora sagamiensis]BCL15096.1 hypothetical protein GCM10017556_28350 [Micromonospora sagamiensis]